VIADIDLGTQGVKVLLLTDGFRMQGKYFAPFSCAAAYEKAYRSCRRLFDSLRPMFVEGEDS